MNPNDPRRYWALDVLRGLCATVVFLSHWHIWSFFAPTAGVERFVQSYLGSIYDLVALLTWPTGGNHPAVIAFFVLSGFCIHGPTIRRYAEQGKAPDWGTYYRRRTQRIMPVYWVSSALGILFIVLHRSFPTNEELLTLHASGGLDHMAVRVAGIAGIYPQEVIAGNYLLNTVSSEILMYAAYPLFFMASLGRHGWLRLGLLFIGIQAGSLLLLPYVSPYWLFNSVAMMGVFWYLGALAAHLVIERDWQVPLVAALIAWAVFLGLKATPHFYGLNMFKQAAWGIVCALFIMWSIRFERAHEPLRTHAIVRFMRFLADISYSLYAVHTPAIMIASWLLLRFLGCRDYFVQLGVTMLFAVVATLLLHFLVERRYYKPA